MKLHIQATFDTVSKTLDEAIQNAIASANALESAYNNQDAAKVYAFVANIGKLIVAGGDVFKASTNKDSYVIKIRDFEDVDFKDVPPQYVKYKEIILPKTVTDSQLDVKVTVGGFVDELNKEEVAKFVEQVNALPSVDEFGNTIYRKILVVSKNDLRVTGIINDALKAKLGQKDNLDKSFSLNIPLQKDSAVAFNEKNESIAIITPSKKEVAFYQVQDETAELSNIMKPESISKQIKEEYQGLTEKVFPGLGQKFMVGNGMVTLTNNSDLHEYDLAFMVITSGTVDSYGTSAPNTDGIDIKIGDKIAKVSIGNEPKSQKVISNNTGYDISVRKLSSFWGQFEGQDASVKPTSLFVIGIKKLTENVVEVVLHTDEDYKNEVIGYKEGSAAIKPAKMELPDMKIQDKFKERAEKIKKELEERRKKAEESKKVKDNKNKDNESKSGSSKADKDNGSKSGSSKADKNNGSKSGSSKADKDNGSKSGSSKADKDNGSKSGSSKAQ